jgi:hypothetical protein
MAANFIASDIGDPSRRGRMPNASKTILTKTNMRCAFALAACVLAGCAIHPLPDDVTGVSTANIVRKIRCEARDAVVRKALAYLQSQGYQYDERSLRNLDMAVVRDPRRSPIKEPAASTLDYFSQTGIVLSFSLQQTEQNSVGLTADFVKPVTRGTFTLTPSVGDSLSRDNVRAFTVSDNFNDLVTKMDEAYCNFERAGPNFQYPIVGRIGVDEMVDTFVDLTLFNGLGGAATGKGPPAMADTLTFVTQVSGGLSPKVAFTPVSNNFQLLDASLTASVMRTDHHQVIVGLGLPGVPIFSRRSGTRVISAPQFTNKGLTAAFISATPKQSGEAAAAQAVAQQIIRFEAAKPAIVAQ